MKMKRTLLEKGTVVVLFILVLVVFSFAERDSKKLVDLYTRKSAHKPVNPNAGNPTAETKDTKTLQTTRN